MNKKLLIGSLSLAIVGISCLAIESKPTYKVIDNSNLDERMAVYIKNETGNYEKSNIIPTTGYILNEEKSTCNNNAKPTWNKSNKSLKISNLSNDNTSCYLYFDKQEGITLSDIIANAKTETPDFSQIADTDEGIYSIADPVYGGTSYYYRGAVTNNYVKFGGFCWRIIRINGDGTIRVIYDGTSCHANGTNTAESIAVTSQKYNASYNASYYVGYTWEAKQRPSDNATASASNLKTQTDSWFNTNIKGTDLEKVADGKFCNDRNTASGYTWSAIPSSTFYYAAYGRLGTNKTPTLACDTEDVYILKVGAITSDEISFAGGVWNTTNNKYYLYNGQDYWTMSPHHWDGSYSYAYVFHVNSDGQLTYWNVNRTVPGARPVISLRADTVFNGSTDGTIDNPYVVEGA